MKDSQGLVWLMTLSALAVGSTPATGCFVPPNYVEGQLDGGSSRPMIVRDSVTPKLGKMTVLQTEVTKLISVPVRDSDEQTLYGRLFLDHDFSKPIAEETETGGSSGLYELNFRVDGICGDLVNNVTGEYSLSVVVTDGVFVSSGTDLGQVDPTSKGGRDQASWTLVCQEVPGGDAGI